MLILVEIFENSYLIQIFENLDVGKNFRKISTLLKIGGKSRFGHNFQKWRFWSKFWEMPILVKIFGNLDFGINLRKISILSKILKFSILDKIVGNSILVNIFIESQFGAKFWKTSILI